MKYHSASPVATAHENSRREVGSSDAAIGLQERFERASERLDDMARNRLTLRLREIGARQENWDARDSAGANPEAISRAISVMDALLAQAASTGFHWTDPFVGLDENGNVTLEWWSSHRKLTLYIGPLATEYVRSWGPNIHAEMEVETLQGGVFPGLWRWLHTRSA